MLKVLLILPTKWKTLDKRVKALSEYLSRPDRLGSIYGVIQIDTLIQPLPDLTLNAQFIYNERDILKVTKPFHASYSAVGLVFPVIKGEKYAGNYYPNTDPSDHKMDFYIKADEKTKTGYYWFEEFVEHEIAHAVALDLGLMNQGTDLGFKEGADNTHFFFYGNDKEGFYKHIAPYGKKVSLLKQMLTAYQGILSNLKKKEVNDLLPEIKEKMDKLVTICSLMNIPIRVTEGFRTIERQNQLYAQGRTTAGKIVTNAKGLESKHTQGKAFDIVFRNEGYDAKPKQWELVGSIGEQLGLNWGGRWKGFVDKPHFEI